MFENLLSVFYHFFSFLSFLGVLFFFKTTISSLNSIRLLIMSDDVNYNKENLVKCFYSFLFLLALFYITFLLSPDLEPKSLGKITSEASVRVNVFIDGFSFLFFGFTSLSLLIVSPTIYKSYILNRDKNDKI